MTRSTAICRCTCLRRIPAAICPTGRATRCSPILISRWTWRPTANCCTTVFGAAAAWCMRRAARTAVSASRCAYRSTTSRPRRVHRRILQANADIEVREHTGRIQPCITMSCIGATPLPATTTAIWPTPRPRNTWDSCAQTGARPASWSSLLARAGCGGGHGPACLTDCPRCTRFSIPTWPRARSGTFAILTQIDGAPLADCPTCISATGYATAAKWPTR